MATLRSFIALLLGRTMVGSAISPENRDPLFRIALKNLEFERAQRAQKGSRAKKTGHTLLVAPQYSPESPENNALFAIWLADFRTSPGRLQRFWVSFVGYTPRSTSSKWFLTDSLQRQARMRRASRLRIRIEPRRVSSTPSALKVWITRLV